MMEGLNHTADSRVLINFAFKEWDVSYSAALGELGEEGWS